MQAVVGATSFFARRLTSRPVAGVVRTAITLPTGTQLTRDVRGPTRTELAVSPAGRHLVFSASTDGLDAKARLYLRAMDQAEALPIPGTESARAPCFSPDGQWVGFFTGGKLQKVPLSGGIQVRLCDLSGRPMGASWGPNGTIVISMQNGGLQHLGDGGGTPQDLTTRDPATEATHRLPFFLPGGKAVLFTVMPHTFGVRGWIEAVSLDSGQRKVLVEDGTDARYVPTGHLVFVREGTLLAAPFDPERLEVRGSAVAVAGGLLHAINDTHTARNSGAGQYGFADWGALVYASGGIFPDVERELFWVDRRGRAEPVKSFGKKSFIFPRLSPDGQKLAYVTQGRNAHLWVHDLARGTSSKLTSEGRASYPTCTPDGSRIAISFSLAGVGNIFWMPWDGSGPAERLTTSKQDQFPASMSSDGRLLAFVEGSLTKGQDIYLLRMDSRQASPIVSTNYRDAWPEFSPDRRWLA